MNRQNVATAQPRAEPATPIPIVGILRDHHLQIKDFTSWHHDMASAKQLLYIGTHMVGYDHLLLQHVQYETQEQLQKETTTLGIKKDIFSPFDMSITFMPKYCYSIPESCGSLLIHSAPPFTLDTLLSRCEQTYPVDYLNHPVDFYRAWFSSIRSRYHNEITDGKKKFFRAAGSLKDIIYPSPARIPLRQRKRFAALIVGTVLKHHDNGIFHDNITTRTVFLRAVNQPVILANYTGIPSRTVEDAFPADFSQMKQYLLTHGQHMRDVFSLALITCRILTGHPSSSSVTFNDTPRPVSTVICHLIKQSSLLEKHPLREYRHYLRASAFIFSNCVSRFLRMFSQKHYKNWRYCNRATGGTWRSLPVIGPAADILFPTRCASVLRSLLDYHWFYHSFIRISLFRQKPRKVGLKVLLAALKTDIPTGRSEYGKVFSLLQGDAAQKRHTFDSIMEEATIPAPDSSKPNLKAAYIIPALFLIVIPLFFIGRLYRKNDQSNEFYSDTTTTRSTETTIPVPSDKIPLIKKELVTGIPEIRDTTALKQAPISKAQPENSPRKKTEQVVKKRSPRKNRSNVRPKNLNKTPAPVVSAPPVSPQMIPPESIKSGSLPAASCHLVPATGWGKIYYVKGECLFCTIFELKLSDEKSDDTKKIGDLEKKPDKYYIVRKTEKGYGKIETVHRCTGPPCEKDRYYKKGGGTMTGPEAVVTPGDIVGFNYLTINAFLVRRKKNATR